MSAQPWRSKRGGGMRNRLRPAVVDALDEYGLPSKGDNRLLDHAAQDKYFEVIRQRCDRLLTPSSYTSDSTGLEKALSGLQIKHDADPVKDKDMVRDAVLMAMRKLREGLTASARADTFALGVYAFIIRTAILWGSFEAYQPALLHLLHSIHPKSPLSESQLHEFVSYHVLDLACRLAEYGQAHVVRLDWRLQNPIVDKVLTALARGGWRTYWKCHYGADRYQACLIAMAQDRVRSVAIQCLSKTYFTIDRRFCQACVGEAPEPLVQRKAVDWSVDGDKITVRRIKGK